MAIQLKSPKESAVSQGIKALIYGPSGAGKTVSTTTAPGKALLISAEAGLLSIKDTAADMQVAEVTSMDDINAVYDALLRREIEGVEWIFLDSISEVGEVVLSKEKEKTKDPRQAYGQLIDDMGSLIRAFRDLPGYNVVMLSKMERQKDDHTGAVLYGPAMPGSKLSQQMPYWFDFVFCLRAEKDQDGNIQRWFQTQPDLQYQAKSRVPNLPVYIEPDFSKLFSLIGG